MGSSAWCPDTWVADGRRMPTGFDARRTQEAWRDFGIGLLLFFVAQRALRSLPVRLPLALVAGEALLVAVAVAAHIALHRFGRFREVTAGVSSLGRIAVPRLGLAGVGALIAMSGVWKTAEMFGGVIDRPLPWELLDREMVSGVGYFIAYAFYVVVTAPVIEELCFRGWMQGGLARRFQPTVAIFTPALLFAVLHASVYSAPAYLLIPLALGLVLGLVARRSRSLWPSILLHGLWNALMLILTARNAERALTPPGPESPQEIVFVLAAIGAGTIVFLRALQAAAKRPDRVAERPALDPQEA
jgi:membrane protease YdiL (CAAX protease family)